MSQKYLVEPRSVISPESPDLAGFKPPLDFGSAFAAGCVTYVVAGISAAAICTYAIDDDALRERSFLFAKILVAILIVATVLLTLEVRRSQAMAAELRRRTEESSQKFERRLTEATTDAVRLTELALRILRDSEDSAKRFRSELAMAVNALAVAEHKFVARAYEPFWNAVEHAASSLLEMAADASKLVDYVRDYQALLHGHRHNFPVFPLTADDFPDPRATAQMLRDQVLKGQTNFRFAMIWAQRRGADDVLIKGSTSLEDAVLRIDAQLQDTYIELRTTLVAAQTLIVSP